MIRKRDLLRDIWVGSTSQERAHRWIHSILSSRQAHNLDALAGFSRLEATAFIQISYIHKAPLGTITRWRYRGWPKHCWQCGRIVRPGKFGWWIHWERPGKSRTYFLRHMTCPRIARLMERFGALRAIPLKDRALRMDVFGNGDIHLGALDAITGRKVASAAGRIKRRPKIGKRDLLGDIWRGDISVGGAEMWVDHILMSPQSDDFVRLIGLDWRENRAYSFGAPLWQISIWRHSGWPKCCMKCGQAMDLSNPIWMVNGKGNGDRRDYYLHHIKCPGTTR